MGSSWRTDRNIITYGFTDQKQHNGRLSGADLERAQIVAIAEKEIGIQEYSENSSPRIDQYNAYAGFRKVAWCASFVSWVFGQAGYPQPRTAWSPSLFPAERLTQDPMPGTVMGIYFSQLKRIGHCGIVVAVKGDLLVCVEGNTNVNGGREGTGVYRKMRHVRSVRCFSEWLKK